MPRPLPTFVFHFTHIKHLPTIVTHGLQCDALVQTTGLLQMEVGEPGIKGRRARRSIGVSPGGVVADYVPFYFAPRSPMMSAIAYGRVVTYSDGTDQLAYLVTTLEKLQEFGLEILLTDRNAVLALADFVRLADGEPADDFIDWPLMKAQYWNDTPKYPDRRERRMAECLVHGKVPWSAFTEVVLRTAAVVQPVGTLIEQAQHPIKLSVRPNWYF